MAPSGPTAGWSTTYLVTVKTPAESKGPWDLVKLRAVVPPDQAFRPLDQSACPLDREAK